MKKFLASVVSLTLVFGITACSSGEEEYYNDYYEDYHAYHESLAEATTTNDITAEESTETLSEDITTESLTEEYITEIDTLNDITDKETVVRPSTGRTPVAVTPQPTRKPVSSLEKTTRISVTARPVVTTKKQPATTKPPAPSIPEKKAPSYTPDSEVISLLNAVNDYRAQNGLNKVSLDPELCKLAYIRAQEQDIERGHTRPDHTAYYSVLDEYHYNYCGCGENIAFGNNVSVISTFDRWKNSSSHNQNMLESRWEKAGIAMEKHNDGSYNIDLLFAC